MRLDKRTLTKAELTEVNRRLAKLEQLENQAILRRFIDDLGHSILVLMAHTKREHWDAIPELAFKHASRRHPDLAALYLQLQTPL